MTGLRPLPARKVLRVLQEVGFVIARQRGSHVKLRAPDGHIVVVPLHASKDSKVGLLRKILREAGITPEEFLKRV
ncbi:MAG: type II toxin-antitoxin system HicA family toxin [Methanobacteriota archaeon]